MVPLGNLAPGAALLSPRGKVLENGMPRFFRRLSEGVFDVEDLKLRAGELADFVAAAAAHYRFDPSRVIAMGFSNGANIASATLLRAAGRAQGGDPLPRHGAVRAGAGSPQLDRPTRVLISNGRHRPHGLARGDRTARAAAAARRRRRRSALAARRPPAHALGFRGRENMAAIDKMTR